MVVSRHNLLQNYSKSEFPERFIQFKNLYHFFDIDLNYWDKKIKGKNCTFRRFQSSEPSAFNLITEISFTPPPKSTFATATILPSGKVTASTI